MGYQILNEKQRIYGVVKTPATHFIFRGNTHIFIYSVDFSMMFRNISRRIPSFVRTMGTGKEIKFGNEVFDFHFVYFNF